MIKNRNIFITAILSMAVIFCALILTNCVTPRHIDEVKAEIRNVEQQNQTTQDLVTRMDSIISYSAEADNKLRNEVNFTMGEIQGQISALLENYNDLLQKIDELSRKQNVKTIIRSSPGSSQNSAETTGGQTSPTGFECDNKYDDAFILVRRGEYQQAIDGFTKFLENCTSHGSVDNAHYWIGESYYALGKYPDAVIEFEKLINDFKTSPNLGRAYYKLARSQQELGKNAEAKKLFQKLIDEYPETLEAQQARERLKDIK